MFYELGFKILGASQLVGKNIKKEHCDKGLLSGNLTYSGAQRLTLIGASSMKRINYSSGLKSGGDLSISAGLIIQQ